jgi:lipid-A-disaccharide synthase
VKYYIIAGEASGDLHASNLMRELKQRDPRAEFRCWGGDLMAAQGATLVKHIRDISFMGFVEVAVNLKTILRNIRFCKEDILQYKPDVVILVDYPGFNLRIAEFAKKNRFRVFYYISPQVWAWKQGRVHKIKRVVDRMFVILPFEKQFYAKFDCAVDFVGHPLLDAIAHFHSSRTRSDLRERFGLGDGPIVALLPGSRRQEIKNMLKTMLSVVPHFPDTTFVVAATPDIPKEFYNEIIGQSNVRVVVRETYALLSVARAALVTSGTATLETGLFGVPEAVCYRGSALSVAIARKVIKIKYISLVNLILDRPAVKEFIQHDLSTTNLLTELKLLLDDGSYRNQMLNDLNALKEQLGGFGASAKAAELMTQYLQKP